MPNARAPRFFYGWLVVLITFFTAFVISGAFVTYGQFIGPLARTFGWSVGLIGLSRAELAVNKRPMTSG